MKIASWNVNGLRAIAKKGFQHWFTREKPDILCIQETKAHPDQLDPSLRSPAGYHAFFSAAEKKGYSGVALFSRSQPLEVQTGFGIDRFDREGRILIATYKDFILFNIYFPNGKQSQERLHYKMDFYAAFLEYIERLKSDTMLIMTGDYNTAHQEIDLAHPKQNEKVSGFLPEERAWMDTYVAAGYVDVFRERHPDTIEYTWWDYKTRARERNIGWRIDYFFVSKGYLKAVRDMKHLSEIEGSDHCPLLLLV